MSGSESRILLFDGVCNLCESSVGFVFRHDPGGRFRFAALQSEAGKELLRRHGLAHQDLSSMVLVEEGRYYRKSAAALRIARALPGLWKLFYVFVLVPAFIRDPIYDWIARNRYRWFGRKDTCLIPGPEIRERFLK